MRVLLTGNEGYIGTLLVPLLWARNHEVVGLDSGLFRECTLKAIRPLEKTIRKDIRDVEPQDLDGIDAVIHLAGLSNDPLGSFAPAMTYEINHVATLKLAALAKAAGVRRFLYASTCSVYGASGDGWLNEDSACNPVTPYAESKITAEEDLRELADASFCPVYLRAATAYGVSPLLRFDLAVNNLVAWAAKTGKVWLKSLGTSWRPFVHIEDIAQAYIALLHAPEEVVHNRAFNVGTTRENFRIRHIAEMVASIVPNTKLEFAPDAERDARNYRVNCDRLPQMVPTWQPRWTLATGIAEVHRGILEWGLQGDFEGPRYNRIAYLKQLIDEHKLDGTLRWRVA